jgi:hypothetical protein
MDSGQNKKRLGFKNLKLYPIACEFCGNSTTVYPDGIMQCVEYPTLFLHLSCSSELIRRAMDTLKVKLEDPIIRDLFSYHGFYGTFGSLTERVKVHNAMQRSFVEVAEHELAIQQPSYGAIE